MERSQLRSLQGRLLPQGLGFVTGATVVYLLLHCGLTFDFEPWTLNRQ